MAAERDRLRRAAGQAAVFPCRLKDGVHAGATRGRVPRRSWRAEHDDYALPPVTLDEAIFDLPPLAANSGEMVECWQDRGGIEDRRVRRYLAKFSLLSDTPLLFNHRSRYNNTSDLELYAILRPGEDSVHAIERHGRGDA